MTAPSVTHATFVLERTYDAPGSWRFTAGVSRRSVEEVRIERRLAVVLGLGARLEDAPDDDLPVRRHRQRRGGAASRDHVSSSPLLIS